MPGILALDQGTVTGWAFAVPGHEPRWGTQRFDSKRGNGAVGAGLWRFLKRLLGELHPDHIVYETPYVPTSSAAAKTPTNAETMRRLLGIAFLIDTFAEIYGIDCREIASVAATKAMTGRGRYPDRRAKKLATTQACWARGWKVREDEADALALLMFAESRLYPHEALSRPRVLRQPRGPLFGGEKGNGSTVSSAG